MLVFFFLGLIWGSLFFFDRVHLISLTFHALISLHSIKDEHIFRPPFEVREVGNWRVIMTLEKNYYKEKVNQ